ncbi:MAG: hypothetical protein NVSMB56_09060 [Pyrinomonadaceae bacterium]
MPASYEYLVCQIQTSRVTFVNGVWQRKIDYRNTDPDAARDSCPYIWDYLQDAGLDGWELVAAVNQTVTHDAGAFDTFTNQLLLKRERTFFDAPDMN